MAVASLVLTSGCTSSSSDEHALDDAPLDRGDGGCSDDACATTTDEPDPAEPTAKPDTTADTSDEPTDDTSDEPTDESTDDTSDEPTDNTSDEPTDKPTDAVSCEYDGQTYAVGESWDCSDDCNDCTCLADGTIKRIELICPESSCQVGDAVYLPGEVWDCGDDWNQCTCDAGTIGRIELACPPDAQSDGGVDGGNTTDAGDAATTTDAGDAGDAG
jgi:hypothetical protein